MGFSAVLDVLAVALTVGSWPSHLTLKRSFGFLFCLFVLICHCNSCFVLVCTRDEY